MTIVRDHYNYRRLPKKANVHATVRPPTRAFGGLPAPDADTSQLLHKELTDTERETILLRTAKAGRAPLYLDTNERLYATEAEPTAIRRNNLGVKYLDFDLTRAFRNFLDAVEIDDTCALAHNNLGLVLLETGQLQAALTHLNRAIELEEGLDVAHGNRGLTHLELNMPAAAYQDFSRALELDPEDAIHHNNLGVLFLDIGEPDIARDHFTKAIQLAPDEPLPYLNRGLAWRETGEHLQAKRDFNKATEIEDRQYQELLEEQ